MRGLQRMVDEDTYCIDVLTQVRAADQGAAGRGARPARRAPPPLRRRGRAARRRRGRRQGRRGDRRRSSGWCGRERHRPRTAVGRASTSTSAGMTCASCAARVEKQLNRLDGVDGHGQLRHRAGHGRLRPDARRRPTSWSARSRPSATAPRCPRRRGARTTPATDGRTTTAAEPRRARALRQRLVVAAVLARAGARCCRWCRRCSSTTGSGWRSRSPPRSSMWARLAVPPGGAGRTSATAPRRWTRSISLGVLAAYGWSV